MNRNVCTVGFTVLPVQIRPLRDAQHQLQAGKRSKSTSQQRLRKPYLLLACRGVRLTSGLRVLSILFCRNQVERYAIYQLLTCRMFYVLPCFLVLPVKLES